jgi:IS5 family transposase
MFKVLFRQAPYNLRDDIVEYQVRDRVSFLRFLRLGLEDRVPDAKPGLLYREAIWAGEVPDQTIRLPLSHERRHLEAPYTAASPPRLAGRAGYPVRS